MEENKTKKTKEMWYTVAIGTRRLPSVAYQYAPLDTIAAVNLLLCVIFAVSCSLPSRVPVALCSIHVGAAVALENLDTIQRQLKVGGRLVAPVEYSKYDQRLVVVRLSMLFVLPILPLSYLCLPVSLLVSTLFWFCLSMLISLPVLLSLRPCGLLDNNPLHFSLLPHHISLA